MAGALIGTKILAKAKVPWLRVIFAITIAVSGVQMVIRAIQGDV